MSAGNVRMLLSAIFRTFVLTVAKVTLWFDLICEYDLATSVRPVLRMGMLWFAALATKIYVGNGYVGNDPVFLFISCRFMRQHLRLL